MNDATRPDPQAAQSSANGSPEGSARRDGTELDATRAYYDEFSHRYEDKRGGREPDGYHDLIDTLEVELVRRYATSADVLEVGCGTGLLLERFGKLARSARGVDLSPGMLAHARARGLTVDEASATALPFADASFDVACSFKVLAHVREIETALAEMARVVRPGGAVIAEFYNPHSLRALAKRLGPAGAISDKTREDAVFTRFDSPSAVARMAPPGTTMIAARGVRIVTPTAGALKIPFIASLLTRAEHALCDSPLRRFGGFYIAVYRKRG